ncbi:phenylalanine--tRNA ligase subunit alpha [Candidatus Dojkabacteria bacterium]|uniref:Phenylalanine--tRNA ligase alpha subunit n=1 Tax=Candidatus Dojkabacteria bacterium TaxID=2099670 RepID=A0A955L7P5_9BACT|nr:phenylalanine--tRNA ligase subunit alpha [Candidatus Dojkabacteria bacterium]
MSNTEKELEKIKEKALEEISNASSLEDLETVRVSYLGRKSELTSILRSVKDLSAEEKPVVGKKSNEVRVALEDALTKKKENLASAKISTALKNEWLDVTRPVSNPNIGHKHPISKLLELTEDIFSRMGFDVYYPNEIDTEFHNFTAVNIPEDHPAKDMWDTFWTEDDHVAITHTSSMQHRILKNSEPPIRAIVPGRTFRNEATDARHEHTFYQVEGIYVDKGITMSHMLGTLKAFFSEFFEQEVNILFTPDFFPFVEPGGMISIDCSNLGEGFKKVSKGTGWLEVLGCGMIHPEVLSRAGVNPEVYSGFAWGFGLERMIMLKYGIDDVRLFHSGDLRFIKQF